MPTLRFVTRLDAPCERVFEFFCRPTNAVALAPPGWKMALVEAPTVVEVGASIVVTVERAGLSQRIRTEVVEMVAPERLVEEQRQGPFKRWRHARQFVALSANETELTEEIDFAPPGGLLGFMVTAAVVERELTEAYRQREEALRSLLSRASGHGVDQA